jgi:hypothetical protein
LFHLLPAVGRFRQAPPFIPSYDKKSKKKPLDKYPVGVYNKNTPMGYIVTAVQTRRCLFSSAFTIISKLWEEDHEL